MSKPHIAICLLICLLASCDFPEPVGETINASNPAPTAADIRQQRHFQFRYAASIADVPAGATVKVWVPIAETNPQQTVQLTEKQAPAEISTHREKKYGNSIGFFQITQPQGDSPVDFRFTYDVRRQRAGLDASQPTLDQATAQRFLTANRLVPKTGKPIELLANQSVPDAPQDAGRLLYKVVESHMKYDKSIPGYGTGDSVWACDSKTGNCTDFHSLFISLARSRNIPARFEIGFPLADAPTGKIGGYHCWAWFHVAQQGWLPVDISEADKHPELKSFYCGNLTADRISFSQGRDIQLVPASQSPALNYFVYPHVEVDGQIWPTDKINLEFSHHDHPADSTSSAPD